jgi:hypothetical protein
MRNLTSINQLIILHIKQAKLKATASVTQKAYQATHPLTFRWIRLVKTTKICFVTIK